jgi:hypothetical protein
LPIFPVRLATYSPSSASRPSRSSPPPAGADVQGHGERRPHIIKATWGAQEEGAVADVTKLIAGLVKGNALSVQASTKDLGDPAKLKVKQLRVEWSRASLVGVRTVQEGETLTIDAKERPAPVHTVITKAVYGHLQSGKVVDVTDKIASMVVDNALSLTPTNALR